MVVIIGFVWFGFRDKSAGQWIWTLANHYDTYTSRWTAPDPIGDAGGDSDWYGFIHPFRRSLSILLDPGNKKRYFLISVRPRTRYHIKNTRQGRNINSVCLKSFVRPKP